MHKYTGEEKKFFAEFVPGHSHREIQQAFIEKFGWEISMGQVKSSIKRYGLNTGRTGYFSPGHIPANKGRKGIHAPGSEKTWFEKGHAPANSRPIGSERVDKDGYIMVKVAEPNKWASKHRVIYEQHYGKIPPGNIIIFKDGNKTNCNIDNLIAIPRATNMILNHTGLCTYQGDSKDTAVKIAELRIATNRAKRREKYQRRNEEAESEELPLQESNG